MDLSVLAALVAAVVSVALVSVAWLVWSPPLPDPDGEHDDADGFYWSPYDPF
ncbi:MAG: hypothetical protein ACYDAG_01125 [Chloroflexota bacterium]